MCLDLCPILKQKSMTEYDDAAFSYFWFDISINDGTRYWFSFVYTIMTQVISANKIYHRLIKAVFRLANHSTCNG